MDIVLRGARLEDGKIWVDVPSNLIVHSGDTISLKLADDRPTLGEVLMLSDLESRNVIRGRRNELEETRVGMDDTQYKLCKPTTTDVLLQLHDEMCRRAREIMRKKNSDYGARDDPFSNFHSFGALGILVRLSDKMARIRTFLEKAARGEELAVSDESWDDTVLDAINYLILFAGYVRVHGAKK